MNKKGFTLTEILTAVIIVAILTVMAVPLYEKTIERSRMAEARSPMNRLQSAKLAAMDKMDCTNYSYDANSAACPRLEHLGVAFVNSNGTAATGKTFQTKDFEYSLEPTATNCANGISAKRLGGEYKDTVFVYYGLRQDGKDAIFACVSGSCGEYGLDTKGSLDCNQ